MNKIQKSKQPRTGNTRVTGKEQYYTPATQVDQIIERVNGVFELDTQSPFLEPAGGTGAFIEGAKRFGFSEIISYDIEPKHYQVVSGDFLTQDLRLSKAVCITNPPFGRNNSLSIPFFNKAALYSDVIALILPRSWRKWSVLNRLDKNFRLIDDWNLHIDYVDEDGAESHGVGNLNTCVQVWKRDRDFERQQVNVADLKIIEKSTPINADVSFTLFGYGCGTVKTEFPRVPNTTQAFFKLNHDRALEALQNTDFSPFFNHTAYTQALGIKEINYLLNEYLGFIQFPYSTDPSSSDYLGLTYKPKYGLFNK